MNGEEIKEYVGNAKNKGHCGITEKKERYVLKEDVLGSHFYDKELKCDMTLLKVLSTLNDR